MMMNGHSIDLTALAQQVLLEQHFIPGFSSEINAEVSKLRAPIIPQHRQDTHDMRHLLFFSIDNDDSRDLDQLTYAEKLPGGKFVIYVAVADVDILVKKHSAIDRRASQNTTSIYTPTKVFPMLPEELSTDLTSLNPGEDRFALIFEGVLDAEGKLESYSLYRGYVHNHAKLAYDSVSAWLDGKAAIPEKVGAISGLSEQVQLQDSIAKMLDDKRHEAGALSVQTIEARPVISDGIPIAIVESPKNRGKLLIENFMIIANRISAKFSNERGIPSLRRVVVVPKRWDKIVEVAAEHGTKLPENPDPVALERFLVVQQKKNPEVFPDLSLTIIKLLGNGEYRVNMPGKKAPGHFGLAIKDYSHSTAPNRRFPDLITQRLLLSSIDGSSLPYTEKELYELADHCTLQEDTADKIERRLRKSAAALVLSDSIGQIFDAIVTGASEKGTWVRIFHPPVEGKLVKGAENVDVGDRLRVKLVSTDVRQGYIDFVRV